MRIIAWNSQELGNSLGVNELKKLCFSFNPGIVYIYIYVKLGYQALEALVD